MSAAWRRAVFLTCYHASIWEAADRRDTHARLRLRAMPDQLTKQMCRKQ